MKMIWAVIRWDRVDAVVKALKSLKVPGCTITSCRGYGKEWHIYEPIIHGGHRRLEIIVEDSLVDPVIEKIVQSAQTSLPGDGLIGVVDLEKTIEIKNHASTRS
jgi:nitrogen regulatory protein P-II 1